MSPYLQKADRAMIDARCSDGPYKLSYIEESLNAIIDHLMKQERGKEDKQEDARQDAPRTPSFGVWRDIATAPRDGTEIVIAWAGCPYPTCAFYSVQEEGWTGSTAKYWCPTHWTPLPPPPTA